MNNAIDNNEKDIRKLAKLISIEKPPLGFENKVMNSIYSLSSEKAQFKVPYLAFALMISLAAIFIVFPVWTWFDVDYIVLLKTYASKLGLWLTPRINNIPNFILSNSQYFYIIPIVYAVLAIAVIYFIRSANKPRKSRVKKVVKLNAGQ